MRIAVVLFNLGGPDSPEAVRPFLRNLFTDPAILRMPAPLRAVLGRLIAWRRAPTARDVYARIGGRSPLLPLTESQAEALEAALAREGATARCFVAMRYWHPFAAATARAVREWGADRVLLLPLYPQYSTTTTGSSVTDWQAAADRAGLDLPTTELCCWHSDPGFADATAAILDRALAEARAALPPGTALRLLFSAHGLPEPIVKAGDPYQWQVEQSVAAVLRALDGRGTAAPEHVVCYQSRVTPQRWIGPDTEAEVKRAARDGVAVLVCPIAFVSEHSETLVELDIEYRELGHRLGLPGYFRVPAQNSDPGFIEALARLALRALDSGRPLCSFAGARQCPKRFGGCPHAAARERAGAGDAAGRAAGIPEQAAA
ncbi:ferrochelatase [Roseomonas sp. NAR14]|uniref:Ferrochelatase n=1 Tax=Roseomonas acroporae TaxID=2937791 RepID=A0A9X1Y9B0_9PROT|nr:ferrochelatase [Roseomonas acroporae]MCK8784700.1 ferrochelatase [Roseomonas acroporae]